MKKFIQICSLLSLLVLFTAGSTFAQTGFGTDVDIPFAFNIGDRSYDAGNYIVRLEKLANGSATLSILDTKTEETQRVLLNANGDSASGEVKLVFDTIGGQRYLTRVKTPDRTYALIKSKAEKNAAKAQSEKAGEAGAAN
jgi:hypothetical protein